MPKLLKLFCAYLYSSCCEQILGHGLDDYVEEKIRVMHEFVDDQKIGVVRMKDCWQVFAHFVVNCCLFLSIRCYEHIFYVRLQDFFSTGVVHHFNQIYAHPKKLCFVLQVHKFPNFNFYLIMFNPISSLTLATSKSNSWFSKVGRNVMSVVRWIAWSALRTLHVSLSEGKATGFGSNSRSACENTLNKCWSFVFTVEAKLKETVKMGLWPSIQVISGPAF